MEASVGLRKVRDLEDMIGRGTEIVPIERPYMKLLDDPRVLAYSDLDAASFAQLELKLAAARRFRDEVRHQAMRDGVPVGMTMAASGLGGAFGMLAAFHGPVEEQARLSIHPHMHLWYVHGPTAAWVKKMWIRRMLRREDEESRAR